MENNHSIAVLIPCFNEEVTILEVVKSFKENIPSAIVYVYDNNSTDNTAKRAELAGAVVRHEHLQGKGNVVRRMFADVEADIYILSDGDDTYDTTSANALVDKLHKDNLDMVVATRVAENLELAYPKGHQVGNKLFSRLIAILFGEQFDDVLSGYRVLSRRFVKSFPALSRGFEIETEMTIHALELRLPVGQINTKYRSRPHGSESKLATFKDGLRIISTITLLLKEVRPMLFFNTIFLVLSTTSALLAWPLVITYLETGLVPRFPTAILCTGLMLTAIISLVSGIILDSVTRGRREAKRMNYLNLKSFN